MFFCNYYMCAYIKFDKRGHLRGLKFSSFVTIMIISSIFSSTNIRLYLISYIQCGNGTNTAFQRTFSSAFR